MSQHRVPAPEIPDNNESDNMATPDEKHSSGPMPDKGKNVHEKSSTIKAQQQNEIKNPSYGVCLTNTAWAYPVKPSVPPPTHTYTGTKVGITTYYSGHSKPKPTDLVAVSKPLSTKKKIFIGIGVSAGIVVLLGGAVAAGLLISGGSLDNQTRDNNTINETTTPAQDATKAPSATKAPGAGDQPSTESWGPWNAWSTCEITCGPGHKQRSRTCSGDDCIGSNVQGAVCNLRECPRIADTYNQWGRWASWTQCGTSCGNSTQSRARLCTQDTDKMDCVGESSQVRVCNGGICPDCSLPCSGSWDTGCFVCTCSGVILTGRVTTQLGGPLDNATVSPSDKPYTELAVTGMNGGFSVNDICNGQELLFTLAGYESDSVVYNGENNIVVVMKKTVPLTITKQPLSAGRLTSSCIELRCEANGSPQPDYYEWFQDGMLIIGESGVSYAKTNLNPDDTGLYRCRASNDYSAVISHEVLLNIKGLESEFCQRIPLVHNQNLPIGCTYNGKTQVDIGKCSPGVCSKGGESACSENNYECGIITSDLLDIDCGTYRMAMQVITECGCVEKGELYLELLGTLVDAADDSLIEGILITYEDISVTSDADGDFVVTLTPGTTRMTLSLTDPSGRYSQQVTSFNIGQNLVGSIEHTIALNPRPKPIIVSPVNEILLELGLEDAQPAFADLVIPPNSVFDSDGNPFVGDVSLTMNTFNPANPLTRSNPPGDFTAIGPDGEEQLLESTGMMQLNMQDTNGNSLKLGGNIEILLPESVLGSPEDIGVLKLWILNPDGRWVYSSDINSKPSGRRKKRYIYSTTVRGIDIDDVWCNFDTVKDQICHTKIRAYQTDNFNENEQLANVGVQVVTLPSGSSAGTTLTRIRSDGDDTTDGNGYCIVHPCNSKRSTTVHDYHGYIIADYQGIKLTPASDIFDTRLDYELVDDKIYAKFDYFSSPDGPFYDWDYYWSSSQQCSGADITGRHFRFYRSSGSECSSTSYSRLEKQNAATPQQEKKYSWYPKKMSGGYRTCFVKVATSWNWPTKIEAISAAIATDNDLIAEGEVYGVRSDCTENKAACLEIRAPFGISENEMIVNGDTLVTIRVVNEKPSSVHINNNLLNKLSNVNTTDPNSVQVQLFNDIYGPEYGIFCSDEFPSRTKATKAARNACRRGSTVYADNGKSTMTTSGWAIWFGDYDSCPGNYSSRGRCTDGWLDEWFEYCNEGNFVCNKCFHHWDYMEYIPEHYNSQGQCDSFGRIATPYGCCPSCPTSDPNGYYIHYCSADDNEYFLPYEFCMMTDTIGLICETCPAYHTIPEYPNASGQCSYPNHKLTWEGCCPNIECPGGHRANQLCNVTEDCNHNEYCTGVGYCCLFCPLSDLKPEAPNVDGQCSNPEHYADWRGCCPSLACPGGYQAYSLCNASADCHYNDYCTDKGYCCSKCPLFDIRPLTPNADGQCSDPEHYPYREGCCPRLCPGEQKPYQTCNVTSDCFYHEFCKNGVCCEKCWDSNTIPEDINADGSCSTDGYDNLWGEGCCPTCPDMWDIPVGNCNTNTDCPYYTHCTDKGICCHSGYCPYGWSSETACSTDNDCESIYEHCYNGYCCTIPDCHDGTRPSNDKTCIPGLITCESDEYCNSHGYCCPIPSCYDSSSPIHVCLDNYDCDIVSQCAGVCCSLPLCSDGSQPISHCHDNGYCPDSNIYHCTEDSLCCSMPNCTDGSQPTSSCSYHHDCNTIVEHCTDIGICCPLPSCPDGSQPTSSCSYHHECSDPAAEHCFDKSVCCPIPLCPDGLQPISQCDNHHDCADMTTEYCTESGICCQMPPCPDGTHPTSSCLDEWWCQDPMTDHCTVDGLCCPMPSCPNGVQPSSSCSEHMHCPNPMYEICTVDGICCPLPSCPDGSEPTVACPQQDHNYCSPAEYCSLNGICCLKPICSDGVLATQQCLDNSDCQSGEQCTPSGFCCPMPA